MGTLEKEIINPEAMNVNENKEKNKEINFDNVVKVKSSETEIIKTKAMDVDHNPKKKIEKNKEKTTKNVEKKECIQSGGIEMKNTEKAKEAEKTTEAEKANKIDNQKLAKVKVLEKEIIKAEAMKVDQNEKKAKKDEYWQGNQKPREK